MRLYLLEQKEKLLYRNNFFKKFLIIFSLNTIVNYSTFFHVIKLELLKTKFTRNM